LFFFFLVFCFLFFFCFVFGFVVILVGVVFYGAPAIQCRPYDIETEKITLAKLGYYKPKLTPWVKATLPAGAKRYMDTRNSTPFCRLLRSSMG
jgi:hypothetical protein